MIAIARGERRGSGLLGLEALGFRGLRLGLVGLIVLALTIVGCPWLGLGQPQAWAAQSGLGVSSPLESTELSRPVEGVPGSIRSPLDEDLGSSSNAVSAEQISRFVQAYLQVFRLIEQREGELQAAETESESLRIQHDVEAEAYRRIEANGLSQREYLQILSLANVDPELGEQIAAQLQE